MLMSEYINNFISRLTVYRYKFSDRSPRNILLELRESLNPNKKPHGNASGRIRNATWCYQRHIPFQRCLLTKDVVDDPVNSNRGLCRYISTTASFSYYGLIKFYDTRKLKQKTDIYFRSSTTINNLNVKYTVIYLLERLI